jgi:hypothetical protein
MSEDEDVLASIHGGRDRRLGSLGEWAGPRRILTPIDELDKRPWSAGSRDNYLNRRRHRFGGRNQSGQDECKSFDAAARPQHIANVDGRGLSILHRTPRLPDDDGRSESCDRPERHSGSSYNNVAGV